MDELVVVEVVATQAEAELLCSLLRNEGIRCTYRVSDYGAGGGDGLAVGGPQEVIVRSEDLAAAREILKAR
jgi:Putative prokaryotic signal transducing protein